MIANTHKHKCSNGHIFEHEFNEKRQADLLLNEQDHTCPWCKEVVYNRFTTPDEIFARVKAASTTIISAIAEKHPDLSPGETVAAFFLIGAYLREFAGMDKSLEQSLAEQWDAQFKDMKLPNPFKEGGVQK